MVVRWSHKCPWKAIAQYFPLFSQFISLIVGNDERICFSEDLWWGNHWLCSQYPDPYRVNSVRNLTISIVIGLLAPSTLNLNFQRNLDDSKIEHLQRLLFSLGYVHLFPSNADSRVWSLSPTSLFTAKSFFLALSMSPNLCLFYLDNLLWSSKVHSKVKAFAWSVAHRKVNTNNKLQLRRPYKSRSLPWCVLDNGDGESIDHLFLHCHFTFGSWHKLFNLASSEWVSPRSIEDIFIIAFRGFGISIIGKTLCKLHASLVWFVWQDKNARIFENKKRSKGEV